jgi:cytochrome c oxidase subunit 3
MSLISRLTEKSWQSPGHRTFAEPDDYRPAAATVGLYVYFGVATVLFLLIAGAYVLRMGLVVAGHEHGGGSDWRPMPEPPLLWINSGILLASSLAWEFARRWARTGQAELTRLMTITGSGFGLAFLLGQLLLWQQFQARGYYLAANPANAFFYLLTAVHGVHLAGGLAASARTLGQMDQMGKAGDSVRAFRNVRLCAVYWHFLLLVWVLLAGLLLST